MPCFFAQFATFVYALAIGRQPKLIVFNTHWLLTNAQKLPSNRLKLRP